MAIETLGRLNNVVPIAAGVALALRDYASVLFVGTGNDTFTLTLATSFGGSYSQPSGWNPVTRKYTCTSTGGTAKWVKATQAASNAVTIASGAVAFELLGPMVPDTYTYVKCSVGASGLVTAILNPVIQRAPANLAAVSA